jgi:DNA replication protein DnaC
MQKLGSDGFTTMLARIQAEQLEAARERGFDSVDSMVAYDEAEEQRRRNSETERISRDHRKRVIGAMSGRLTEQAERAIITGDGLAETAALLTVREWLAGVKPVLILGGGVGIGKSVAAAWALASREGTFQALRAVRLGSAWERWSSDREDGVEALRLWVDTMLIDDLGQEPIEDRRTIPAIEEVFDSRQTSRQRTICTTNLSREQMRERYSDRVISRLAQNAMVVFVKGTDLRRGQR